jgi:hypothetical protein
MKKLFVLFAVLAMATAFTSCKKDCTCTTSSTAGIADVTTTVEDYDGECSDMNTEVTSGGYTVTMECE